MNIYKCKHAETHIKYTIKSLICQAVLQRVGHLPEWSSGRNKQMAQ